MNCFKQFARQGKGMGSGVFPMPFPGLGNKNGII